MAAELTTTEAALLLACARTCVDDETRHRIDGLLRGPIRWTSVVDAAAAHGVQPLLHSSLAEPDSALVPAHVRQRIRSDVRANVHHALFLTAELRKLLAVFGSAGLTAVPFKGPILGAMAYGDVTLRQFTDLDIFVRKSELPATIRVMLAQGYLSDTHDGAAATDHSISADQDVAYHGPSYYTFYRPDGRCRVDLQWRMADRFFAFSLEDPDAAWDLVDVPLAGQAVRTFSATDTLLILCVHGSKHQWEELKWICDVAECVRSQRGAIDWAALRRKALHLRAERMVGLGLRLAQELLGAALPADVSQQLQSDRALAVLVRERRETLFGNASAAASSVPRLMFYLRTKDGWRDKVRFGATYMRQLLARLVKPNALDTAWVALPHSLWPLYYVVRPVRVLATYAARPMMLLRRPSRGERAALSSEGSRGTSRRP